MESWVQFTYSIWAYLFGKWIWIGRLYRISYQFMALYFLGLQRLVHRCGVHTRYAWGRKIVLSRVDKAMSVFLSIYPITILDFTDEKIF